MGVGKKVSLPNVGETQWSFFLCSEDSQIASSLSFQKKDDKPLLSLEFLMQPEPQRLRNISGSGALSDKEK